MKDTFKALQSHLAKEMTAAILEWLAGEPGRSLKWTGEHWILAHADGSKFVRAPTIGFLGDAVIHLRTCYTPTLTSDPGDVAASRGLTPRRMSP